MFANYYVYALKDPRTVPSSVFYVGKGIGTRDTDHLKKVDNTRKGKYIQQILDDNKLPLITRIVENLTEEQALRIELELISSFGTVDSGGSLYNTVIPKTIKRTISEGLTVPVGALEKAQLGLKMLKESITLFAEENPNGITNSDCAQYLGLQSDHEGNQQDYLTYSTLGLLLKDGVLASEKVGRRKVYKKQ